MQWIKRTKAHEYYSHKCKMIGQWTDVYRHRHVANVFILSASLMILWWRFNSEDERAAACMNIQYGGKFVFGFRAISVAIGWWSSWQCVVAMYTVHAYYLCTITNSNHTNHAILTKYKQIISANDTTNIIYHHRHVVDIKCIHLAHAVFFYWFISIQRKHLN